MKRKICIINPNTTKAMTQKIDLTAKKFASADTEIVSVEPNVGPESIEGFYDEAFCIPGLVEEIEKHSDADSYIIACFDDTGLEVIRSITEKPVIGIGEAAYHIATMVAGNFTVITTLSRSIRPLTHNLKKYGLFENCVKVTAIEVPVLDLENISKETNCAVLMISHDLHVVMSASDRVICINGHICCQGTPENVATSPEYQTLFGSNIDGSFALYRHKHDHNHDVMGR